jgi:hypothetical protein
VSERSADASKTAEKVGVQLIGEGPAHRSRQMAVAMGFDSVDALLDEGCMLPDLRPTSRPRDVAGLARCSPREVVSASDVLGSGIE